MKKEWHHLDKYRGQEPPYTSPKGATFGAFQLSQSGRLLRIIATDGCPNSGETGEWEHVSIHAFDPIFKKEMTPTWDQMCFVKSLFWEPNETVIQYHPAESDYVNTHPHVLHLWRPK